MNFDYVAMLTHLEKREGKNGVYTIITLLTNQGKTIDCIYKGKDALSVAKIPTMSKCVFSLEYTLGKFNQIVIHDVKVA